MTDDGKGEKAVQVMKFTNKLEVWILAPRDKKDKWHHIIIHEIKTCKLDDDIKCNVIVVDILSRYALLGEFLYKKWRIGGQKYLFIWVYQKYKRKVEEKIIFHHKLDLKLLYGKHITLTHKQIMALKSRIRVLPIEILKPVLVKAVKHLNKIIEEMHYNTKPYDTPHKFMG